MKVVIKGFAVAMLAAVVGIFQPVHAAPSASEAAATRGTKLSGADRQKIRHVITLQLKAFQRNDETVAFSYSTPEIRRHFGSSRNFMDMVLSDYSMLVSNLSQSFLEAAVIDGQVIQPLRIVTREGESVVALYIMERQPDKEWRIAGCEIAPSTLQAI